MSVQHPSQSILTPRQPTVKNTTPTNQDAPFTPAPAETHPPADPPTPRRVPRPRLAPPLLNALAGLLLFTLYVTVLARNDIDDLMGSRALPALPGGWKSLAALQVLVLLLLAARILGATRLTALPMRLRSWAISHPVALAVGGLTLAALALRLFGISDNLPYTSNPDEPAVADRALGILQTGDYNPHYFVYPNLYTYMQAAVFLPRFFLLVSSGTLETLDQIVPTDFYLWGRLLTALLGTLTVPIVFLAARRLYGITPALVAAAFMATNSVHLVYSQLITTDVPATFFSALSLLTIASLLPPSAAAHEPDAARHGPLPSRRLYFFAGVAMGLAVGTKYNSALVVLPFLLAHAYAVADHTQGLGHRSRTFFGGRLWLALASMAGAFLLTTPFALLDLPNFLNDIASVLAHYRFGHLGFEGDDNWRFYFGTFLQSDFLPTLLSLVGVIVALACRNRADLLLLSFPLVFYLSMSSYRVNFTRNMLPIIPFTSILAAMALALAWKALLAFLARRPGTERRPITRLARWLLAIIVLLGLLPQTAAALQRGYRQTQPDTRLRAAQWLDANTRPGTKLWLEFDTPKLTPGRYLIGSGQHVTEHPMDWYVANRYEYLVLSAGAYKPVVYDRPESDPSLRDAYLRFFDENRANLVVSFETNKVDHPGPTIQVYRTGYAPPKSAKDVHAQHTVNAHYHEIDLNAGLISLLGADFPRDIQPGTPLPITLYWTTDRPLNTSYTVFVHLIDASGNKISQIDVAPRSGTYPTSLWPPGEVVVDEVPLTLPVELPPGEYHMRVGLYLQIDAGAHTAFTLTNAPPNSGGDYVLLGPLTAR